MTFVRVGITGPGVQSVPGSRCGKTVEGTAGSVADVQKAAAVVADGVDANTDLHASAGYRHQMARVYTARALTQALARAS